MGGGQVVLPASALYRLAVLRSHRREHTFSAYTPDGEILAQDVPITGGSVAAQLGGRVTRSATWSATDEWYPSTDLHPLSPYQSIVRISAGIGYPNGNREVFPVFTGRVYRAQRQADGGVTFRADDLAADVLEADFESPVRARKNGSVEAEIQRLILGGFRWATFGVNDVVDARMPELAWDDDRGKALDDLAAVVEGRWFTLGNGDFVTRAYNYTDTSPVASLTDGEGGTITSATTEITADGSYNSVVVISERPDGGTPIKAVERNRNTLSAARYNGNFGKRVRKIRSQSSLTLGEAQRIARSQLDAATALQRQWTLSCVPDYTLEPGDVVRLTWRGLTEIQVIDSITYPLTATDPMRIATRSTVDTGTTL